MEYSFRCSSLCARAGGDGEPVPDHTTMVRHLQTIPPDWMDLILAETGRRCIAEAAGATGPLGADSSGVETTRYENIEKPYKRSVISSRCVKKPTGNTT